MGNKPVYILGIESSCDDTSAAVLCNGKVLANIVAGQEVHRQYGGVVPELASRAHQAHIIPVVHEALALANITKNQLDAVAVTYGPGLSGPLLVGVSFAKGLSQSLQIPLIGVHHMQAHILSHFIDDANIVEGSLSHPQFPFLCLTVSGGHTQIVRVSSPFDFEILGETIDDAAGEAFDKGAKMLGLPYPGGPEVDKISQSGNPHAFHFPEPSVQGLDFSFSGLKTSLLYLIRDKVKENADFIDRNRADLAASFQKAIITVLIRKLQAAVQRTGIQQVALAGGVSANSALRYQLVMHAREHHWQVFIPKPAYSTDNAAMVAMAGYMRYKKGIFSSLYLSAQARLPIDEKETNPTKTDT
ncbi:MAG: tRNA (adenosine(37)-N6)-threonylcarbamoyltransferase complex transferase subunit TsaD [Candidatus Competibacteraceae bacterium]|nr:tRNA (adenosine(37)-N6)-threonylcarbamoyltransferase complex transferase subunit TsaD [Candidatus Competibacteraceae bacterium]